jgi:hypothetical protein
MGHLHRSNSAKDSGSLDDSQMMEKTNFMAGSIASLLEEEIKNRDLRQLEEVQGRERRAAFSLGIYIILHHSAFARKADKS